MPKLTFDFPETVNADQRKKWESHANDLGACKQYATNQCMQKITVTRMNDGKPIVQASTTECKLPPAESACVEKIVAKQDLPVPWSGSGAGGNTAGWGSSKVGITFR